MKTKFGVLKLEKKAITKLNDQQIVAVKGGIYPPDGDCTVKTSTVVNCTVATATNA